MTNNTHKIDEIIYNFLIYLKSSGLSENSIKFYKSDLSAFVGWKINEMKRLGVQAEDFKGILPFLKPSDTQGYKNYLLQNKAPVSSVNRRLSSLRRISVFLNSSGVIDFDLAKNLENVSVAMKNNRYELCFLVKDFQKHLEAKKASKNTIKNYTADIQQFLSWFDHHYA